MTIDRGKGRGIGNAKRSRIMLGLSPSGVQLI